MIGFVSKIKEIKIYRSYHKNSYKFNSINIKNVINAIKSCFKKCGLYVVTKFAVYANS